MFIDLHMHEMRNSGDSFLPLEEIVEIAKKKGLDAICITDHDSMDIRDFAQEYSRKTGFPIFVGIEFYSLQGDIIAYGVRDYPRERVSAQAFIDLVREQGGVCYSAHPFRNNRRGMEEHLDEVTGLSGIEVLNGSTHRDACLTAAATASFTRGSKAAGMIYPAERSSPTRSARAFAAASFISSLMSLARASRAPRKMPGKASTLLIWLS